MAPTWWRGGGRRGALPSGAADLPQLSARPPLDVAEPTAYTAAMPGEVARAVAEGTCFLWSARPCLLAS